MIRHLNEDFERKQEQGRIEGIFECKQDEKENIKELIRVENIMGSLHFEKRMKRKRVEREKKKNTTRKQKEGAGVKSMTSEKKHLLKYIETSLCLLLIRAPFGQR